MHLRSVIGGIADKQDRCTVVVSTIGGSRKDNIRLESTSAVDVHPDDREAVYREYARWRDAVRGAAQAQLRDAPGQPMQASFGVQEGAANRRFAGVLADECTLELASEYVHPVMLDGINTVRRIARQDTFAALGKTLKIMLARRAGDTAPLTFTMPYFQQVDPPEDAGFPVALSDEVAGLIEKARQNDGDSLEILRHKAADAGRNFARFLPEDTRFVRLLASMDTFFRALGEFDLREYFVNAILRQRGWKHHLCVKVPGDPASPLYTDIATSNLADRLAALSGDTTNGFVALKL